MTKRVRDKQRQWQREAVPKVYREEGGKESRERVCFFFLFFLFFLFLVSISVFPKPLFFVNQVENILCQVNGEFLHSSRMRFKRPWSSCSLLLLFFPPVILASTFPFFLLVYFDSFDKKFFILFFCFVFFKFFSINNLQVSGRRTTPPSLRTRGYNVEWYPKVQLILVPHQCYEQSAVQCSAVQCTCFQKLYSCIPIVYDIYSYLLIFVHLFFFLFYSFPMLLFCFFISAL